MKRPARAPLPLATLALAASILAVFAGELGGDGMGLCGRFGFVSAHPTVVSAFTSLFFHDPSTFTHVAGNLAVLVLVGSRVERAIGSARFAALSVAGGLVGALFHVLVDPSSITPLVGCSGSLFALLAVAGAIYGAPMLAFVVVLAVTNIAHAFGVSGEGGVSFGDHLGGFASGVALVVLARLRGINLRRAVVV